MAKRLAPVHPGEFLVEDFCKPHGLSLDRLAFHLDVPSQTIVEIATGQCAVTSDTALRLAQYFGTSADVWLNLQARYDRDRSAR